MSQKSLRILFVTSEIDPFLKITDAAIQIRKLPEKIQELGHEVRILMPKFGVINERRNRLHEVVRLSGINIKVGNEEKPLTIKVASIPNAKLQVYFLDNEDYFQRKSVLLDPKNNKFHADNDERAIFFCKGVIETVKKLGWTPDIIHCHDWMSCFVPMLLKTHFKDDPMFKNTKIVFTVYNNSFDHVFSKDFLGKAHLEGVSKEVINKFERNDYVGFCKGGMAFSDVVTKGTSEIDTDLQTYMDSIKSKDLYSDFDENSDTYAQNYNDLYTTIAN